MLCVNTLRWSDIWLKNGTLDRPYLLTIFPPKYPFPSPQSSRNIVLLNTFLVHLVLPGFSGFNVPVSEIYVGVKSLGASWLAEGNQDCDDLSEGSTQ